MKRRPSCIFLKAKPTLALILVTPNHAGHLVKVNVLGAGMVPPSIPPRATSFDTVNIYKALSNLRFALLGAGAPQGQKAATLVWLLTFTTRKII